MTQNEAALQKRIEDLEAKLDRVIQVLLENVADIEREQWFIYANREKPMITVHQGKEDECP